MERLKIHLKKKTIEVLSVEENDVPTRLDAWVYKKCEAIPSRSFAALLIKSGKVNVQRAKAKPSLELRNGDIVTVEFENAAFDFAPEAENLPLKVIFEDCHILVIDKPAGLVVHPGAGIKNGTLVNAVLNHCGQTLPSLGSPARAGIVHRLDRDTSGVMVVAKSQLALTSLSVNFSKHEQFRKYNAICYSSVGEKETKIVLRRRACVTVNNIVKKEKIWW